MQWATSYSGWMFVACVAVLTVLLWVARRLALSPAARSLKLLLLRGAVLGVLLTIIAGPVQVRELQQPPQVPGAVMLFDASRSMSLEQPLSRAHQSEQLLAEALRHLPADHPVHLGKFQFGSDVRPLSGPVQPVLNQSHLMGALEDLPARFAETLPSGIFLFSDGRATDAASPQRVQETLAGYRNLGVPIHVVAVGDPEAAGDVALRDVVVPRDVPPGTNVPIKVVVGSSGCQRERVEIQIRSAGPGGGQLLASLPITLTDSDQTYDLSIEADQVRGQMVIEIPPRPHEAFTGNNRVTVPLNSRSPKIRVIYMEGTLGNEYRFIRDALVEDPEIECLAIEVNAQYAQIPTLHRVNEPSRGFPVDREELFSYDVVICSDINRASFTQQQLEWVVELVGQRGGGFVMIGGNTSFGAGNWDQTIWDGLIPVDMSGRQRGYGTIWNVNFRPSIPADQQMHPVWRMVDDPVQNQRVLQSIPPLYGTNRTDRVKPGAVVLAYSDVPVSDAGIMPIVTAQSFGRGRTLAFSPDSTVDWGRDFERNWGEGDNRYFRKFWRNVVRWLAENSAGKNRRLRVESDKLLYRPGETLRLSAQVFDDMQSPTEQYRLESRVRRGEASAPGQAAGPALGEPPAWMFRPADKSYEARIEAPALDALPSPGGEGLRTLAIETTAWNGEKQVAQVVTEVQLLDDSPEYREPRPDHPLLESIAAGSDGRVLKSGAELAEVLKSYKAIPGVSTIDKVPLWDRAWVWMLLIALLAAEWIARRATGLA